MWKAWTIFLLSAVLIGASESAGEYVGTVKPDLVAAERMIGREFLPARPEEQSTLRSHINAKDRLFIGEAPLGNGKSLRIALVEPAVGEPYIFADTNFDQVFEDGERHVFRGTTGKRLVKYPEVELRIDTRIGPFSSYPIRVLLPEKRIYTNNPRGRNGRYLLTSLGSFVQGTFDLGGRPVLAIFFLNPTTGNASATGWQGMDCNGDGWIDEGGNSDEFVAASDEAVIFHVDQHYVSAVSVDLDHRTFVVREHPSRDANRIPLRVGEVLPEFQFTDLDGKVHESSELAGKFVLLDFWATWCGPCVAELGHLENAWERFRDRDFVVLGISDDDDPVAPTNLARQKGITYPQAVGPTALELVRSRLRIDAFPTIVLIDKSGKVVSINDASLRGNALEGTLDKLLPAIH